MKPKSVTIDLSQDEIKDILKEWAQREYPGAQVGTVSFDTHEYGDRYDNVIGRTVSASMSVRLNSKKEG